jgi:HlyD family secretion protein
MNGAFFLQLTNLHKSRILSTKINFPPVGKFVRMNAISFLTIVILVFSACSNNNGKADAYGNFETVEILVASEIQGKLVKFTVEEGQNYNAGDIVGLIDTVQLNLKRAQLVAQRKASATKISNILSQINVQEEQKRTLLVDKNRVEKLLKDNAVPIKQLDDINGKISIIESQIASIRTQNAGVLEELTAMDRQIDQIQDQLHRCKIINPIKGTILEKYAEPSEIILPGKALYKIANMEQMILRVYVTGSQLPTIKIGQKIKVLIDKNANENETLEGNISWISAQAEFTPKIIQTKDERVTLVYAVKIMVKNDGKLKIGMPGEVKF